MENINEKLNRFSALVLRDAQEQRDRLMSETEDKYESIIAEKENEYLSAAYESIQKTKSQTRREAGEELLHAEMESKKKLLLKREELINDVMDSVKKRLEDFTKSNGYEGWLCERAKKAVGEAGDGEKIIYVSPADLKYKDALEKTGGAVTVESAPERDFLGGLRVYNAERRVAIDYSFRELLAEEKQTFMRNSGLAIR